MRNTCDFREKGKYVWMLGARLRERSNERIDYFFCKFDL